MSPNPVESAAFAIYREFIRGGVGTRRLRRTSAGATVEETADEAAERRWHEMPERQRDRFRCEAQAALAAVDLTEASHA